MDAIASPVRLQGSTGRGPTKAKEPHFSLLGDTRGSTDGIDGVTFEKRKIVYVVRRGQGGCVEGSVKVGSGKGVRLKTRGKSTP